MKLEVVERENIPYRPRARFWVPADSDTTPAFVLEMIAVSNPDLDTSSWVVTRVEEPKDGTALAFVVMDEASKGTLDRQRGELFYGLRTVNLKIYGAKDPEHGPSGVPSTTAPGTSSSTATAPVEEAAGSASLTRPNSPRALSEMGELAEVLGSANMMRDSLEESSDEADITVVEAKADLSSNAEDPAN